MDVHELTAGYALDALDPAEREQYEAHLGNCEPCREELQGFWSVTGSLARASGGPAPSPLLRERILTQARSERTNVVPLRPRRAFRAVSAVAAVAAVAALGIGIWASTLASELDDLRGRMGNERQAVAVLSDPQSRTIPVSGANGRLVVSRTGQAALVLSGLDRAPAGKVYEIWVIEAGSPRPAGLFAGADTRTVLPLTRPVPEGAVVAVTLEPAGGVEAPTGSPLFTAESV